MIGDHHLQLFLSTILNHCENWSVWSTWSVFISNVVWLNNTSNLGYKYSGIFQRSKNFPYVPNFQWVQHSIFPKAFNKFLKFEVNEYLINYEYVWNVKNLILCKLPILFSTMKPKLGLYFSQFIHRFMIWFEPPKIWTLL